MNIEAICYLLRKTSMTRGEIGKLAPSQLNAIVKEVQYQEAVDEYTRQSAVAHILAAIYNTIPRKQSSKVYTAKDFMGMGIPTRDGQRTDTNVEFLARRKGIILPKG